MSNGTPIVKAVGETPSEKYLALLGNDTFLNLWSYPNVFIDKRQGGVGQGKELCDLLVLCGNDVIIFSDKCIAFKETLDPDVCWARWYRAAIEDSVRQVNGAIRWISQFPEKIYLDKNCTQLFPIAFPPQDKIRFHGVVISLGAKQHCNKYFKRGSGSLRISPRLRGDDHTNKQGKHYLPFSIGDVNPDRDFIHVFDDVTLDIVLRELDTVTDFSSYLTKRTKFIRSGHLEFAEGEENLLAYYLLNFSTKTNDRDFCNPKGKSWKRGEIVFVSDGMYDELQFHPSFLMKKMADEISYFWDRLIHNFTSYMLKAEMADVGEHEYDFQESEKAIRYMAFECRYIRRVNSIALDEIIRSFKKGMSRLTRAIIPTSEERTAKTAYVFLMLARPEEMATPEQYEDYRKYRVSMLGAYCYYHLNLHRHLNRIIGIALEPPPEVTGVQGMSEDLLMVEVDEWNDGLVARTKEGAELFGIGKPENAKFKKASEHEFPEEIQRN